MGVRTVCGEEAWRKCGPPESSRLGGQCKGPEAGVDLEDGTVAGRGLREMGGGRMAAPIPLPLPRRSHRHSLQVCTGLCAVGGQT